MADAVEVSAKGIASRGGNHSLTAAATVWGFSDISHLNRILKAELGSSPSEYRAASDDAVEVVATG